MRLIEEYPLVAAVRIEDGVGRARNAAHDGLSLAVDARAIDYRDGREPVPVDGTLIICVTPEHAFTVSRQG